VGVEVGTGGVAVSVADGGEEGVSVGTGEGDKAVGRKNVGEGEIWATKVAGERTLDVSRWLNRKLPSNIPTLMSVMARLPSSCPGPVVGSLSCPWP
jgi:hypothetical protein